MTDEYRPRIPILTEKKLPEITHLHYVILCHLETELSADELRNRVGTYHKWSESNGAFYQLIDKISGYRLLYDGTQRTCKTKWVSARKEGTTIYFQITEEGRKVRDYARKFYKTLGEFNG